VLGLEHADLVEIRQENGVLVANELGQARHVDGDVPRRGRLGAPHDPLLVPSHDAGSGGEGGL